MDLYGGKFTWKRCRGTDNWVREKLDRAFASSSWWSKFPQCHLKVLHNAASDHEPLLFDLLRIDIPMKIFRFRFENMWLREPSFTDEVIKT